MEVIHIVKWSARAHVPGCGVGSIVRPVKEMVHIHTVRISGDWQHTVTSNTADLKSQTSKSSLLFFHAASFISAQVLNQSRLGLTLEATIFF